MVAISLVAVLIFLAGGVSNVAGICVRVNNEGMEEYSCTGGSPTDMNVIPRTAEKICISEMSIPRITGNMFNRFGDTLCVLKLSYCGIEEIEPDAFRALTNLQQLSLNDNKLTTVKASWFKGLNYLTYLDVNYNSIKTIEDDVYQNLPSLVDFRISGNQLTCLNFKAMSNLQQLKRMFLSENKDFQCPDEVSKFLDNRGVSFDKDPKWKNVPQDLVSAVTPTVTENPTPTWIPTTHINSPSIPTNELPKITEPAARTEVTSPPSTWVPSSVPPIPIRATYKMTSPTPESTSLPTTSTSERSRESSEPPVYSKSTETENPTSVDYSTPRQDEVDKRNVTSEWVSTSSMETTTDKPLPPCPNNSAAETAKPLSSLSCALVLLIGNVLLAKHI